MTYRAERVGGDRQVSRRGRRRPADPVRRLPRGAAQRRGRTVVHGVGLSGSQQSLRAVRRHLRPGPSVS